MTQVVIDTDRLEQTTVDKGSNRCRDADEPVDTRSDIIRGIDQQKSYVDKGQ